MRDMNPDLQEVRTIDDVLLGWFVPGGRFMPVIAGGADGEKDEKDEKEGEEESEEEESEEEEEEIKDPKAAIKAAEAKVDRFAQKLKKKDKTISDLQKEIENIKKDASSPDEKVQARLTELEKKAEAADSTVADRDAVIAILNNDDVAKLPRRRRDLVTKMIFDQVELDGSDDNIEELLDELREEDPAIFDVPKPKGEKDDEGGDDEEEEEDESSSRRRTASPPKKKKGEKGQYDRATLEKRMPHLRRHRG